MIMSHLRLFRNVTLRAHEMEGSDGRAFVYESQALAVQIGGAKAAYDGAGCGMLGAYAINLLFRPCYQTRKRKGRRFKTLGPYHAFPV